MILSACNWKVHAGVTAFENHTWETGKHTAPTEGTEDYRKICALWLEIRPMRRLGSVLPLSCTLDKSLGPPVLSPPILVAKVLACLNTWIPNQMLTEGDFSPVTAYQKHFAWVLQRNRALNTLLGISAWKTACSQAKPHSPTLQTSSKFYCPRNICFLSLKLKIQHCKHC